MSEDDADESAATGDDGKTRSAPTGSSTNGSDAPSASDEPATTDGAASADGLPEIDAPSPTATDRRRLAAAVPSLERDGVAIPGLAAAVVGLVLVGGVVGLLASPVVVAVWALAGPVYAATAAALLVGAVLGGDPTAGGAADPWNLGASAVGVAAVAAGIAWLVVAPTFRDRRRWRVLVTTLLAAAATTACVTAVRRLGSPTAAAATLVVAVALALYVLHRYSLVRLAYRDPQ